MWISYPQIGLTYPHCSCSQWIRRNERMIQDTLFEMPEPAKSPPVPPVPPTPVIQAEPLGPCAKSGCREVATLKSPSGTLYCQSCGRCQRKVYSTMKGVVVLRKECKKTVEQFVKHPRLGYVCPCLLDFEKEIQNIERSAS